MDSMRAQKDEVLNSANVAVILMLHSCSHSLYAIILCTKLISLSLSLSLGLGVGTLQT